MPYQSRIVAEANYLQALGQAFYNFTYLEWVVISTIAKLSVNSFEGVPKGKTSSYIAAALMKSIDETTPSLPNKLRVKLVKFHEQYLVACKKRNYFFTPIHSLP